MGPSEVQAGVVASAAVSAEMPVPPVAGVILILARALLETNSSARNDAARFKRGSSRLEEQIQGDSKAHPVGLGCGGKAGTPS